MYRDARPECVNNLTDDQKSDLADFVKCYNGNKDKYESVGKVTDIPSFLVAAIHWRESGGDFTTYLSQGDPLGTRTWANGDSNNGHSLPDGAGTILFTDWNDAAIFALNHEVRAKKASGISYDEQDIGDCLTFAEYYNGLGYQTLNVQNPYLYNGTTCYSKGKFDEDGHYNKNLIDEQLGVLVMLRALIDQDTPNPFEVLLSFEDQLKKINDPFNMMDGLI